MPVEPDPLTLAIPLCPYHGAVPFWFSTAGWVCYECEAWSGELAYFSGRSTGPRTPEGIERCRKTNWKSGERSAERIAERRRIRDVVRWLRQENDLFEWYVKASLKEQKRQERLSAQRAPADPADFMIVMLQPPAGDV